MTDHWTLTTALTSAIRSDSRCRAVFSSTAGGGDQAQFFPAAGARRHRLSAASQTEFLSKLRPVTGRASAHARNAWPGTPASEIRAPWLEPSFLPPAPSSKKRRFQGPPGEALLALPAAGADPGGRFALGPRVRVGGRV